MDDMARTVERRCLQALDRYGEIPSGICFLEIEKGTDTVFDREYAENVLQNRYIYHYETKAVRLGDLWMIVFADGKPLRVGLEHSPGVRFLMGDRSGYDRMIQEEERSGVLQHSVEKFEALCRQMELYGYDERRRLVIWRNGQIRDGHHRASWLFHRYGAEFVIKALVIDSIVVFPFSKVRQGSRVVIYGAGAVGTIYIRQLLECSYCRLVWVVDKKIEGNGFVDNETGVRFAPPSSLFISKEDFDYIVIALGAKKDIDSVNDYLIRNGIDSERIVHNGIIAIH